MAFCPPPPSPSFLWLVYCLVVAPLVYAVVVSLLWCALFKIAVAMATQLVLNDDIVDPDDIITTSSRTIVTYVSSYHTTITSPSCIMCSHSNNTTSVTM